MTELNLRIMSKDRISLITLLYNKETSQVIFKFNNKYLGAIDISCLFDFIINAIVKHKSKNICVAIRKFRLIYGLKKSTQTHFFDDWMYKELSDD